MRKILIALVLGPLAALAQGPAKDKAGPADGQKPDTEHMEKRMRLARTLGLAEALDLDTAQALKLGETLARFDDKRKAARKQGVDAREVLRKAAQGDKTVAGDVDGAIGRLLDSRAQLQATDKEMLAAITKDLAPEQKARAALFLGRFRERIERHMMPFGPGGPGGMHHGMMPGGMQGRGPGMGHGGMGPGMQDCPMQPGTQPGMKGQTGMKMPMDREGMMARVPDAPEDVDLDDPPPFADELDD
jgi:hypothetical protein